MPIMSKRSVVLSAAAAGAAFGLNGSLEILPSALAQNAPPETGLNPGKMQFFRFKVGEIEVTQVFDGEGTRPMDAGFVRNASVDGMKKALTAAGLSDAVLPNTYTITVLKIGDRRVMFDAGNGPAGLPNTGRLEANMKAAGFERKDITTVIATHFHPDHVFGLMNPDNSQIYPNAEILMPAAEYDFWTDPGKTAGAGEARQPLARRVQATFPTWKNIRRFSGDADVLPGVKPVASYGHTPGHTSFHISSGGQQLMVLADITNIVPLFVRNPGWHAAFDQDPVMAEATRRKMFDRVVADNVTVTGYHYGMPGAGKIGKDGAGYVFTPMA